MTDQPVILVNKTIMLGQTVRWFRDLRATATQQTLMTASREGVEVQRGYLTDIPDQWIQDARSVHQALVADRDVDLSGWATHVHRGPSNGPLVTVEEARRDG